MTNQPVGFFQCECCKRRLDTSEDYFQHVRRHRPGDLARRVEPGLFGAVPDITQYAREAQHDPPEPPNSAEWGAAQSELPSRKWARKTPL